MTEPPSECPPCEADAALRAERDRLMQLAAVGEVLPSLLHELRNPLASVTTALEVLIEEMEGSELRTTLHALLGELRRAQLTLQGIGTAGDCSLSTRGTHHAIDYALADACRVMAVTAEDTGIELRADIPTLPLLPIDAAALRGVLFNLLHNAIAATSKGGHIDVLVRLDGSMLEVAVRDDGAGMSPETLARCTETFFTTKPRGSGIGLALAKRTVESVGGWLEIASELGRGTEVTLHVPVAVSARRHSQAPRPFRP
ncbi:MAG: HAMP domain-containing histidine kinase [Myxococcales bacterium]|nr:HAMP domain-containing histidine kinase [Myxococcales bacterium]